MNFFKQHALIYITLTMQLADLSPSQERTVPAAGCVISEYEFLWVGFLCLFTLNDPMDVRVALIMPNTLRIDLKGEAMLCEIEVPECVTLLVPSTIDLWADHAYPELFFGIAITTGVFIFLFRGILRGFVGLNFAYLAINWDVRPLVIL